MQTRRRVRFSSIRINEFQLVVDDSNQHHVLSSSSRHHYHHGDHQETPPFFIELSWNCIRCTDVDVDAYEITRRRRRTAGDLVLTQSERRKLLKEHRTWTSEKALMMSPEQIKNKRKRRPCSSSPKKPQSKEHRVNAAKQQHSEEFLRLQAAMDDIEKQTTRLAQKLTGLGAPPLQ